MTLSIVYRQTINKLTLFSLQLYEVRASSFTCLSPFSQPILSQASSDEMTSTSSPSQESDHTSTTTIPNDSSIDSTENDSPLLSSKAMPLTLESKDPRTVYVSDSSIQTLHQRCTFLWPLSLKKHCHFNEGLGCHSFISII